MEEEDDDTHDAIGSSIASNDGIELGDSSINSTDDDRSSGGSSITTANSAWFCNGKGHGFLQRIKESALWGVEVMVIGIADEKGVLPPDKCRSPVGGHENGLSSSWISYPLMQFLDDM